MLQHQVSFVCKTLMGYFNTLRSFVTCPHRGGLRIGTIPITMWHHCSFGIPQFMMHLALLERGKLAMQFHSSKQRKKKSHAFDLKGVKPAMLPSHASETGTSLPGQQQQQQQSAFGLTYILTGCHVHKRKISALGARVVWHKSQLHLGGRRVVGQPWRAGAKV